MIEYFLENCKRLANSSTVILRLKMLQRKIKKLEEIIPKIYNQQCLNLIVNEPVRKERTNNRIENLEIISKISFLSSQDRAGENS